MSKSIVYTTYDSKSPLQEIYKKRAKKELNEEEQQVQAHLESFRRWINAMPHIKACPKDDNFLLAFLRQSKFNHSRAQTRLDNFCTFRTSEEEGMPSWFMFDNIKQDLWNTFAGFEHMVMLGFTPDGTLCALVKGSNLNLDKIDYDTLMLLSQMWNDKMLMDPRIQIGGFTFIMDMGNISKTNMLKFYNPKISKMSTKYFQEAQPFRIKKIIYLNVPTFFVGLFKLSTQWFSEKTKNKLMVLHDDLKPAFDAIPGLKELTPKDYGGKADSYEELIKRNKKNFNAVFEQRVAFPIEVDESRRPLESRNLMREYKDLSTEQMGTIGTYTKFEDEI